MSEGSDFEDVYKQRNIRIDKGIDKMMVSMAKSRPCSIESLYNEAVSMYVLMETSDPELSKNIKKSFELSNKIYEFYKISHINSPILDEKSTNLRKITLFLADFELFLAFTSKIMMKSEVRYTRSKLYSVLEFIQNEFKEEYDFIEHKLRLIYKNKSYNFPEPISLDCCYGAKQQSTDIDYSKSKVETPEE